MLVRLGKPVSVVMGAGLAGTARFAVRLSAFHPPMFLEDARKLASVRLDDGAPVGFTLVEEGMTGRLELAAAGIALDGLLRAPLVLELRSRTGAPRTVALSLAAINADFSTREKQNTRDEMFRTHRDLVRARAAQVLIQARRAEVLEAMSVARPALWALAAEFPGAGVEIAGLSAPLLALGSEQEQAQRRTEHLRAVIFNLESDPALVDDATTRELKAELFALEPKLAALNAEVAFHVAEIQSRARAAGLEDALLARADFLLGQYPQSGVEGTFEYLLRASLTGAKPGVKRIEDRVRELTSRLTDLNSQLNWYEREPVTHQVATRYAD